ncbi:tagatose-6-phosphate kinase [Amycolatopsis orientalis]|uniref:tagatose-6-phosphate kinase n=1 Tax=Amycolatopsis orientalis TaxID=31958 RepID=UPI0011AB4BCE|nr:tagatose-6-phosphate kinase [Amycolatopsis orientalis]
MRLMLVASRGQIDAEALGGGYVENWTTEAYTDFVRSIDPDRRILLCRDHGGPWQRQSDVDEGLDEKEAMASSLESFRCDIRAGMDLLHVDASKEGSAPADFDTALSRLVALCGECDESARRDGRDVAFEVGLERQDATIDDPRDFADKLLRIMDELERLSLPRPAFVVGQTGTKVVGTTNQGAFRGCGRQVDAVRAIVELCRERGTALKAHNADYLHPEQLDGLVSAGVDAINIAPEVGVAETRAILGWLKEKELRAEEDFFLDLAFNSKAWVKWFPDGEGTDIERATAAGHYVFATEEFRELKSRLEQVDPGAGGVDAAISATLDAHLDRYVARLGLRGGHRG